MSGAGVDIGVPIGGTAWGSDEAEASVLGDFEAAVDCRAKPFAEGCARLWVVHRPSTLSVRAKGPT